MSATAAQKISNTEWEIMRIVWSAHPATAFEIIAKLTAENPSWHPKTVRTLLARLVKKKALGYTARGNVYFYEPLVTEEACVAAASETFLDRVFAGSLKPMLAHFVERRELSKQDLEDLRRILGESSPRKPRKSKSPDSTP